jgi:DNA-3-methyladenine glycosylase II
VAGQAAVHAALYGSRRKSLHCERGALAVHPHRRERGLSQASISAASSIRQLNAAGDAPVAALTTPASKSGVWLGEAAVILAQRDSVIANLVEQTGLPRLPRPRGRHFQALVRAIVYQQLAGTAAAAIYGRLVDALDGDVGPGNLQALSDEQMRADGLLRAKVASLRDLAAKVLDGTVSLSGHVLARQTDDEVEASLREVRGVGPWTAQVFMMFRLGRLDIWPTADLGVRRGYGLAWDVPTPNPRELEPLGEPFRPFRTVLTGRSSGHPIIRSLEPDEEWSWCYIDHIGMLTPELTGSTTIPPSPLA